MIINSKAGFKQLMLNRRNLYRFFARFFQKEIDEEFFNQLKHVEFPSERKETALTEFQDALLRLNEYFEYDAGESLEDLAADYAKTFLGAGIAQGNAAFPYESVYTSPKRVMMQDAWNRVCEIYEAKGIERTEEAGELLEDHIAMEMEFMAWLCDETSRYTETLAGLEEQREFLNTHLLNWAPGFCLDIKEYADTEFYRMVGQLTTGFLQLDSFILDRMIAERKARPVVSKSFRISRSYMNEVLRELKQEYRIYAPVHVPDRGMWETEGLIRYHEIERVEEIVTDRQSDFSPKEVIYPVSQTIFTFDEDSCRETLPNDPKGIIIFMRPCDVNALKRLDNMFLANGGTSDAYYRLMRGKVKIFMMECERSWENCYCVSMGTNRAENFSAAWKLHGDMIELKVNDPEFVHCFEWAAECAYEPSFIEENERKVRIPDIRGIEMLRDIAGLKFWEEYNDKCISCGGCNTVCPTCSCFDTVDYLNQENSRKGERRRIWSSCMLPDFSKTAGGSIARAFPQQMMRFKTMHKVYDYNARFGGNEHMCVGCGRCIIRCPEDICFADTVNRLSAETDCLNYPEKSRDADEQS
ncbi:MAG: anaerobic sulfite reductase subunit AsrA [Lachnospiraceae bacterium]|nr:anaerobic sulfite reductase subunit AsrA [Lachnospiraceae bacterium]